MKIGLKIFFMIGNITAWFSQAIMDGKIDAEECFRLVMVMLAGLGVKTSFDVTKMRDAMVALAEEEATPNPEDAIDYSKFMGVTDETENDSMD